MPEEVYTQKEMLARIQSQLDRIELKLETKADSVELDRLVVRVENMEKSGSPHSLRNEVRIAALERRFAEPASTPEGRQGLEIYEQYKKDHILLDSVRTFIAFAKFLGVGGVLLLIAAVAKYYMDAGGKLP